MAFKALKQYSIFFQIMTMVCLLSATNSHAEQEQAFERDKWLKQRFGAQHQALIPVVAVADMLFSCQQEKQITPNNTIKSVLTNLDKNALAEKLIICLAGASPKSDIALNYGLKGCFYEQLNDLTEEDRQQKMLVVINAIGELSREERQKSFTKCVTEQAIQYLR